MRWLLLFATLAGTAIAILDVRASRRRVDKILRDSRKFLCRIEAEQDQMDAELRDLGLLRRDDTEPTP